MSSVYRNASLVIIAASGTDANSGLPGVRRDTRSVSQYVESITPGLQLIAVDGVSD